MQWISDKKKEKEKTKQNKQTVISNKNPCQ